MGRATRIVERLHLRADSESAVRRALPILEDAFRTATLPDVGARLIFVRRLHLGRLPKGASAQSLSLLLESRVAAAGWKLVHAGDAEADAEQAVWFRDSLEAHELAALYIAAGRPVDAWFWPLAVPALARATSPGDRLRAIAFSVAAQEEAPAALPAWVGSMAGAGHRERLTAALRPGDGTALRHAAGAPDSPAGGRIDSASVAGSNGVYQANAWPAGSAAVSRGGSAFAAPDDRFEFIEQMLSRTPRRPSAGPPSASVATRINAKSGGVRNETHLQPALDADAQRMGESAAPSRPVTVDAPIDFAAATRVARDSARFPARTQRVPARDRYAEPMCDDTKAEPRIASDARSNATHIDGSASPWAFPGAAPTAAGGLVFLVPTLERLGFGQWCATQGAAHVPASDVLARQIFHVLLSRLRIAEDDPAWQLAASADEMSGGPTSTIRALTSTCGFRVHAEGDSPSMTDVRTRQNATIPEIWLAACRRSLRLRAHIGLATLVVRPARLALTATHVDVFFELNAADLRVRRAGLDIDPGWVPWLTKVVTFHYQDRPWT